MKKEKGTRIFTITQQTRLFELVEQLEKVKRFGSTTKSKQKEIRDKLRNIGLYWRTVAPGMDYTVANLQRLFDNGTLKVIGIDNKEYQTENQDTFSLKSSEIDICSRKITQAHKCRKSSDEYYVIDLCDKILGKKASRQHRFEFLRGDTGVKLPVDAYYPELNLVIEYYESQHTESTPFFDKKITASGVSRDEQRRIYDRRRREILPQYGIKLVILSYTDFGNTKKIKRDTFTNEEIVKNILRKEGLIN